MKIQSWDGCFIRSILISAALALAGCGGGGGGTTDTGTGTVTGTTSFTVGGLVAGLKGTLVLQDNGGDDLAVNSTSFTFATAVADGSHYSVTVRTQPVGQICKISGSSGIVTGSSVYVAVTCTNAYTVGGNVTGLTGSVTLQDNGGDNLTISADSNFTFATPVADGSTYKVSVLTQPSSPTQTCSVSSGAGTISGSDVSVVVVCSATTYTVGVSVSGLNGTAVLQVNDGDDLTVTNGGPFTFATQVAENSPYNVTLLSLQFPNQTCTGGSGTLTTNVTVPVTCVKNTTPRFAYVANNFADSISAYIIDSTSGALTPINCIGSTCSGNDFLAGSHPFSVTVDPSGKFAYVANNGSNDVSAYTIGSTGVLTPIICSGTCSGNNFPAGTGPRSVTVDPTGKFAYVANYSSNDVSAYTIDGTGALTPISCTGTCSGINFPAGLYPNSVTIDPTGRFAYVANQGEDAISAYTIDSTGALTPISCTGTCSGINFPAGTVPGSVTVDPSGKFAYVANWGSDDLSVYTIDNTGALTPIICSGTCSGINFPAGTLPNSVTVDPSGQFAYVANWTSGDVSAYTIDPGTGALTAVGSSPFAAGTNPYSVTVDPSGKFVYVANEGDDVIPSDVSAYTMDPGTGALSPISCTGTCSSSNNFPAGIGPFSVTTTIHLP